MISVKEATLIIQRYTKDFGTEAVPLEASVGRILRETIVADRDFPPYDRIAMDGIAIRFADYFSGQRSFKVSGVAAAGAQKMKCTLPNACLEVMTGAIMPDGLDTVVRYEDVVIENDVATIQIETVKERQNIHFKGSDCSQGTKVLLPGKKIDAPEVGVCATVGKSQVEVSRVPKTLIVSSGDELVDIDEMPAAHQIRKSNIHQFKAVLKSCSIEAEVAHLVDEYDVIVEKLRDYLTSYEVVILSGGVSKGKFDFLPKALEELGVEKQFHRVAQRPGKPFWFGTCEHSVVFAFPGNPVSSFMCMQQYFKPWLTTCLQVSEVSTPMAVLDCDVVFKPGLTYFLDVSTQYSESGVLQATPVKGNGSGDLVNMTAADAYIVLPPDKEHFLAGDAYPIVFYR